MANFSETRKSLADLAAERAAAEAALFRAKERARPAASELEDLYRRFDPSKQAHVRAHNELKARQAELAGIVKEREVALGAVKGKIDNLLPLFLKNWSDPRENAAKLDDALPIMLFPLRLETRFREPGLLGDRHQLLARVYPDDCLVNSFEENLSQSELKSARIFWREYFRAAGKEADERAAWRGLVASHGAGRAAWIIKAFRPLNQLSADDTQGTPGFGIKPQSPPDQGVVLVVAVATSLLNESERTALGDYWSAVWKADGVADGVKKAWVLLAAAVGEDRAGELAEGYQPYNLTEKPPQGLERKDTNVLVSFLFLPQDKDVDTKARSWMKAAKAELLPERFVLLGYRKEGGGWKETLNLLGNPVQGPFAVSPDPESPAASQFLIDDDRNLELGEELRWMSDFDEAERRGMGFRVDLGQEHMDGFDRLFVLGLRIGSDGARGKSELEELFKNHYFSSGGFAFVPQGTPTNNTEEGAAGYSRGEDIEGSYDFVFKGKAQFVETDDWLLKRDGQWFAEYLGLDCEWLKQVPYAGGGDQREARAMNTALWPATLGYFMDTQMRPAFSEEAISYTRWFFTNFVSGRGLLPAIRIGRQPYGILPVTAFTNPSWLLTLKKPDSAAHFTTAAGAGGSTPFEVWLSSFKLILHQLHGRWGMLAAGLPRIGRDGKVTDQSFMDIVGLSPVSVEFHQRYAHSELLEHNIAALFQLWDSMSLLPVNRMHDDAFALLKQLGYQGEEKPPLFDLFWKSVPNLLGGPLIQMGPLSEGDGLKKITADDRNYLEWLRDRSRSSFNRLREEDGFKPEQKPNALLYLLLRHALQLGYHDAGVRLLEEADPENRKRNLRKETDFFHVRRQSPGEGQGPLDGISRYSLLYAPHAAITGNAGMDLVEYITQNLVTLPGARYLSGQIRAIDQFALLPTARLERILVEHLDCCSYRLDAWMLGLVGFQLCAMRGVRPAGLETSAADAAGAGSGQRNGIYLGAYGWLEDVRSENKHLKGKQLDDPELVKVFHDEVREQHRTPILLDDQNGGYVHAPSINHAITAAVLRNGYVNNATPSDPEIMKVNLSSERVRNAMGIIEGIRNGQSLGALLGYQFERGLHDRYAAAESDMFIYPLRKLFPLNLRPDDLPEGVSIETVQARNVLNGVALVDHVKKAAPAARKYPFGFAVPAKLPLATAPQQANINAEVDRMMDTYDAVADLGTAEGVHQLVMGNFDAAAAALDAYSQATFPPLPDVVQTPRSGMALTHRVGLHFEGNVAADLTDNPRVKAEPAMNKWLGGIMPPPATIACKVEWRDAASGTAQSMFVTQQGLGLQPLDLLYVMNPDNLEARSELEDRVRDHVLNNGSTDSPAPRPDADLSISYMVCDTGQLSFFEVAPMVRSLRALLLRSRPLRATDVVLPSEAKQEYEGNVSLARARVDFAAAGLKNTLDNVLTPLIAALDASLSGPAAPDTVAITAGIDGYIDGIVSACKELALYGIRQTGFGIFHEMRGAVFGDLVELAGSVSERWEKKLAEYDGLKERAATEADEVAKIMLIIQAERAVSTTFTDTAGKSFDDVLAAVEGKKGAFASRKALFDGFVKTAKTKLSEAFAELKPMLPTVEFDLREVALADAEKQVVILASDILVRAKELRASLEKLLKDFNDKLNEHDGQALPSKKAELLLEAAKMVFGEEFVVVPSCTLGAANKEEWAEAHFDWERLLKYQKETLNNAFPVDDWLYGMARVREKMHHVENLIFLTEALGGGSLEPRPVQFPFDMETPWLALEFPPKAAGKLEYENLLYTAVYPDVFEKDSEELCGLLLDEWTEVIPGKLDKDSASSEGAEAAYADTETTGIAFHFDKPNAEPPQAMLLATPPRITGAWSWNILVETLHDTLDLARMRAVEPRHLDETELSVFLPSAIMSNTTSAVSMGLDLSRMNPAFVQKLKEQ